MPDEAPSRGSSVSSLVGAIRTALQEGRGQDAIAAFTQALNTGIVPRDGRTVPWLVSSLGKTLASKLIDLYVHLPCFYCTKGRIACEACEGDGATGDGLPCECCLGTRLHRCDFCAGSGWMTINHVPDAVKSIVICNRASLAIRRASALLAEPLATVTRESAESVITRGHLLLLNLDRQMGVFENMFTAFKYLPDSPGSGKQELQAVIRKSVALAHRVETRQGRILRTMADAHRVRASDAPRTEQTRLIKAAVFFESLGDLSKTFAGTGLEHAFLHQAIVEATQQRQADKA